VPKDGNAECWDYPRVGRFTREVETRIALSALEFESAIADEENWWCVRGEE
jgi:hypothetical protein